VEIRQLTHPSTHACGDPIEPIGFTLVSKLLGTILADQHHEILAETRSQDFLYDQGTGMEAGPVLETTIVNGTIEGTDEEVEIRLSGTVENNLGQKEVCTLYFFMWWDRTALSLSKVVNDINKKICPKTVLISPKNTTERLSDSVFELDIFRKSLSGQQQFLGLGRGYLVFGNET